MFRALVLLTRVRLPGTNRIDQFQRVPTDLRKYLEYVAHIKAKYGSVMRFVVQERLGWGDGDTKSLMPKGKPFEYSGRYLTLVYTFIYTPVYMVVDVSLVLLDQRTYSFFLA